MAHLGNLPNLALRNILLQVLPEDIEIVCRVNQAFAQVCRDPEFWHQRTEQDFGERIQTRFPSTVYHELGRIIQTHDRDEIERITSDANSRGDLPALNYYLGLIMDKKGIFNEDTLISRVAGLAGRADLIPMLHQRYKGYIVDHHFEHALAEGGHRDLLFKMKSGRITDYHVLRAAKGKKLKLLEELLSDSPDKYYLNRALEGAAEGGHLDLFRDLINRGADSFGSALFRASAGYRPEIIYELIDTGRLTGNESTFDSSIEYVKRRGDADLLAALMKSRRQPPRRTPGPRGRARRR